MNARQKIALSVIGIFAAISLPILLHAQNDVVPGARVTLLENGEMEIVGNIVIDATINGFDAANVRQGRIPHADFLISFEDATIRNGETQATSIRISPNPAVSP